MEIGFEFYKGKTLTFIAPSGHKYTIREQNGDDDEILSLTNDDKKSENIFNLNRFLSKIIQDNTVNNQKYITPDEVSKLKLKDKYYILLKSRLHSIGNEIKFTGICRDKKCNHETSFKEDLNIYDTDLSKFREEEARYKYQITPYPDGKDLSIEFGISSGKKLRYTFLNVESEFAISQLDTVSENTELYARNLEMFDSKLGEFQKLSALNVFGKKDMTEIKKHVAEHDKQFMMFMELKCAKCDKRWEVPFLYLRDFFFPGEI